MQLHKTYVNPAFSAAERTQRTAYKTATQNYNMLNMYLASYTLLHAPPDGIDTANAYMHYLLTECKILCPVLDSVYSNGATLSVYATKYSVTKQCHQRAHMFDLYLLPYVVRYPSICHMQRNTFVALAAYAEHVYHVKGERHDSVLALLTQGAVVKAAKQARAQSNVLHMLQL